MHLNNIKKLIQQDLNRTKQLIHNSYTSKSPLINEITLHLINTEGKMIRPVASILSAHLCGYTEQDHLKLASSIELIHTATLLHDDVIDNANLRREKISTNYKWGNKPAILTGDFLMAKASQIITTINNQDILNLFTSTTCTIVEGEMLQFANRNNINISETTYLDIISKKTAALFEAATITPAILANCPLTIKHNIANYGSHLGISFQLMNDLLDYQETTDHFPSYKDIQEGNITLPIIFLLANGTQQEKNLVQEIINTKDTKLLPLLHTAIASSKAIAYTIDLAKKEASLAKEALSNFVNSAYKTAAIELLDLVIAYKH
jgi:octaprenyl-diphosphate synthase